MKSYQVLSTLAFFMLANSMPHGMSGNEIAARSLSGNLLATTILSKRTETPKEKEARLHKAEMDRQAKEQALLLGNAAKQGLPLSINPGTLNNKGSSDNLKGNSGTSDAVKQAEADGKKTVPLKHGGK
jgi:hypothetical protein